MKGYHLYIARHGRTNANTTGEYIGKTDIPLSIDGMDELLEKFENYEYPKVQKVYSSPLLRCIQTAEIIFPDRLIQTVDDFREMDFGAFEGLNVSQLAPLESYKNWLKGGLDNAPPNGESMRDMIARTYLGLKEVVSNMMNEGLTECGLVSHSGIIMNLLSCFGLPKQRPLEYAAEVGEGFEVIITAQMWQTSNAFEILGKFPL